MSSWTVLAGWFLGWALLWRLPGLTRPRSTTTKVRLPSVSIVVPARNEADRMPTLLASLAGQQHAADQVIVVDDESSDGTAAVARSFAGVEVVAAPPLPDGWAGKPWACATGARSARGDLLVFLDADVDLAPTAIGAIVASWQQHGGLLSVQPHHRIRRPVEALSLPFNVISMMGLGVGSVVPPRRQWGAAGPCLATDRRDYEAVGGHAAVADEVAEDLALAERYRAADLRVTCVGGHDAVRFRMYRDAAGILEGWSKNLATGAGRTPRLRSLAIAAWVAALLAMALQLTSLPSTGAELRSWAVVYLAGAVQIAWLGRQVGRFGPAALAWPLLLAVFVAVFARSVINTALFRHVRWSGRELAVARRR